MIINKNIPEQYGPMINELKSEVINFYKNFSDDYNENSGWGHNYFCHKDGGKLIFDLNNKKEHRCEICGKIYTGTLYENVWVYNYRNMAINTIIKSAFLFSYTDEEKYLEIYKNILTFYSENYTKFKLHDKTGETYKCIEEAKWGCGRILPQGLNESILTVRLLFATEIIRDKLDKSFLDKLYKNLFKEIAKILIPQVDKIHNIICWNNAAIGSIGLFFNDEDLIKFAFEGEYNVRKQIEKGLTEDDFWYEGSMHYNFFTLEGLTYLLFYAKQYNYNFGEQEKLILKMYKAPYYIAFHNGVLPNPNDGWPNINLKTYSYIYAMASYIYGEDSEVANIYKNILSEPLDRGQLPLSKPCYYNNKISLERLVLCNDFNFNNFVKLDRKSKLYESSQFCMLRDDKTNIFLKYGHKGPSHAHYDKMNIEVTLKDKIIAKDLSNAGYGAEICKEWHRVSASHNTVVANGLNHVNMDEGSILEYTENKVIAKVSDVYKIRKDMTLEFLERSMNWDEVEKFISNNYVVPDEDVKKFIKEKGKLEDLEIKESSKIDYIRNLSITESGFKDKFSVESTNENTYDYFFHVQGEILSNLSLEPSNLGFNNNGYQHIQDVQKYTGSEKDINIKWNVSGLELLSLINLSGKELFIAKTYDNPISSFRTAIILRAKSKNTSYEVEWKIK